MAGDHSAAARCILCGCSIARDHRRKGLLCSPCERSRRDYNPRLDCTFDAQLETLFRAHPGELIFPRQALGVALPFKSSVADAIRRLRRRPGLRIVGYRYTGGYMFVGPTANASSRDPQRGAPSG
jgi:hypothetical protein